MRRMYAAVATSKSNMIFNDVIPNKPDRLPLSIPSSCCTATHRRPPHHLHIHPHKRDAVRRIFLRLLSYHLTTPSHRLLYLNNNYFEEITLVIIVVVIKRIT